MKAFLPVIVSLGFIAACSTGPKWTVQQRRALQMKTFNTSYGSIFKSIKNILQDDGYIIVNQDYKGGFILAEKKVDNSVSSFGSLMSQLLVSTPGESEVVGQKHQVSFNIERVNKKTVETRLTIVTTTKNAHGGSSGREVVDPNVYKSIYQRLGVEVQRRIASQRE